MVDKQRSLLKKKKKTSICLCSFLVFVVWGVAVAPFPGHLFLNKGSLPPAFRFTFYLYVPPLLIIQFSRDPIFPS